jgi:hypothetical protein
LQIGFGEAQRTADGGQSHIDHGHVEDDHELRQAGEKEGCAEMGMFSLHMGYDDREAPDSTLR